MTYEIGKFYVVPCVRIETWGKTIIPINGPLHEDREFIGFDYSHWHIDWRFVCQRFFDRKSKRHPGLQKIHAVVACKNSVSGTNQASEIFYRRLKCNREMPTFPTEADGARWIPKMEQVFKDTRLCGMICPHRGISLESGVERNGIVVCPGHGLAWNVKSGRLVPRAEAGV